jgi:hypothetical protein
MDTFPYKMLEGNKFAIVYEQSGNYLENCMSELMTI